MITKEAINNFLREVFTLRTVWIDCGGGKWVVRKKMHPVLRCITFFILMTAGGLVYLNLSRENVPVNVPVKINDLSQIPAPENNIITVAKLPTKDELKSTLDAINKTPETPKMINVPPEEILGYSFNDDDYSIYINKSDYKLSLFKGHELIKTYPIAVGKNPGDKKRVGDNRTPVGDFHVVSIENASSWSHDFRDGKGKIKGAYGPWFIRLDAKGWKGIGIHGTHAPDSLGSNATEGCIRLNNDDIKELKQYAYRNMPVIIREK